MWIPHDGMWDHLILNWTVRSEGSSGDMCVSPKPLNSSQGLSTVPEGPPGLTTFCHVPVPALNVAPEVAGSHERLGTQMALHGEKYGKCRMKSPTRAWDSPSIRTPIILGLLGHF